LWVVPPLGDGAGALVVRKRNAQGELVHGGGLCGWSCADGWVGVLPHDSGVITLSGGLASPAQPASVRSNAQ
jgi:hypothetical protein